jgi:hypothetical protein
MKILAAISSGLLLLFPANALAVTRTVGQTVVYDFNESVQSTPVIPAGMSAQNAVKMEAAQNKPQSFVLTLDLDQVSPGGAAHATASLLNSASVNASASLRDASSNFIATLEPNGEIVAQYDPNMQAQMGPGGAFANLKEMNLNNVGGQVVTHLLYFNAFAKGCAMRPQAAAGKSWHDTTTDPLFGQRTFTFVTADKGVTMTGTFKNQDISQTITADGDCDASTGLVVHYHEKVANTVTSGPPSSIERDLKLRQ